MAASHLACIIGYPVSHSLSPAIHNAGFDALGLDWTYITIAVQPGAAREGIGLLRELGVEGASVTMPHKQDVIPFLDGLDASAEVVGAVNTLVRTDGRLVGHNTDGAGLVRFLRHDTSFSFGDASALILGAGGAARAVAVALAAEGVRVTIAARRVEQAQEIAGLADGIAAVAWDRAEPADLIINATPARDGLPAIAPRQLAVDMLYLPPKTPFLMDAEASGARAYHGLGMLLHQAALQFELWTGREAPLAAMRAAAERGAKWDVSGTD